MKDYNGFTAKQRMHGDKIIKEAIKRGMLPPLSECSCYLCGQRKGILHYHNEDYTPENVIKDAKPVCWTCHMMIHARFDHPKSYEKYMESVRNGKQYPPVYRGNAWEILEQYFVD